VETVAIVLSVGQEHVQTFERGFRDRERPVWLDLLGRGVLVSASLSRLEISTSPVANATQYLVVAVFASGEGHHEHDNHPGFQAWNQQADAYQIAPALAYGGETTLRVPA
jgi:hypothetical protein